jgi:hypothetical protein
MTQYEIARSQIALNMPAAFTFNGNPPYFDPPNSNVFEVNGNDRCGGPSKVALGGLNITEPVPGVATGACDPNLHSTTSPMVTGQCSSTYLDDIASIRRPDNYTSTYCSSTPCTGDVTDALKNQAQDMSTIAGIEALVAAIHDQADTIATSTAGVTNWGTPDDPKIIYIDNPGEEAIIPDGAGILVIRGTGVLRGGHAWTGAVLVVGDGRLVKSGGGDGTTYGGMMVANTRWANNDASGFANPLPANQTMPGPPYFGWSGGGNALIKYDSCAVNKGSQRPFYGIIAYREMTY